MSAGLVRGVLALDASVVQRVVRGQSLWSVLVAATGVLVAGCGAYGLAMGSWRSGVQAVSAGMKLPAMFLLTAGLTAALDLVLCGLLRARVRPLQALTASVLAMATLGAMVGSLSPIAAFVSLQLTPPRGAASIPTSHWLLTGHVLVLGAAGIVAVARLARLLDVLIPDPAVSRRVLWSWMVTHGVVGAQLSWVLRPFVGNPTLPVRALRPRAWEGSFFEAVFDMTLARMGPAGPLTLTLLLLVVVAIVGAHLDPPIERFEISADRLELWRRGARSGFSIPLRAIRDVSVEPCGVRVHWAREGDLERARVLLPTSAEEAIAVFERIGWAMRERAPFRAPAERRR